MIRKLLLIFVFVQLSVGPLYGQQVTYENVTFKLPDDWQKEVQDPKGLVIELYAKWTSKNGAFLDVFRRWDFRTPGSEYHPVARGWDGDPRVNQTPFMLRPPGYQDGITIQRKGLKGHNFLIKDSHNLYEFRVGYDYSKVEWDTISIQEANEVISQIISTIEIN